MANETTTTQNAANGGADGKSVTSELDQLLAEHDGSRSKPQPQNDFATVKSALDAVKPVVEYAQGKMQEEQQQAIKKSVDDSVAFVKSDDALKGLPDRIVRGFLQDEYAHNPSFKSAYDNRMRDPKAWEAAQASAQKSLAAEVSTIGRVDPRSDVVAATAAVRGTGRAPTSEAGKVDPRQLRKLSDTDFAAFKAEEEAKRRSA